MKDINEHNILTEIGQLLIEYRNTQNSSDRLLDYIKPGALSDELNLVKDTVGDWQAVYQWIEQYLQHSVRTGHPGFVNRMWAEPNLPSIIGEFVATVAQTSGCTYESAPVAVLIEKYMFATMLELAGFEHGEAQMTTGSSNANMIALLAARNNINQNFKQQGMRNSPELVAFVSADAHYSLDKAANVIGLGSDNLIKVPINAAGEMDPAELSALLIDATSKGQLPFFVCGTAGTTVRGAYDPIPALLMLREQYGFWLHIDAAWGGSAMLDPALRARFMPEVERVDSLTWDFHKMLGASLMCNILMFNSDQHHLSQSCGAGDGSYLFRETDADTIIDPGLSSLQCGRRVDALKWFLDWKFYGQQGLAKRVNRFLSLAKYIETKIQNSDVLELMAPRQSFNLCFRYNDNSTTNLDSLNQSLRTSLYQEGKSLVGMAWINDAMVLRWLSSNPNLSHASIDIFIEELESAGKELASSSMN